MYEEMKTALSTIDTLTKELEKHHSELVRTLRELDDVIAVHKQLQASIEKGNLAADLDHTLNDTFFALQSTIEKVNASIHDYKLNEINEQAPVKSFPIEDYLTMVLSAYDDLMQSLNGLSEIKDKAQLEKKRNSISYSYTTLLQLKERKEEYISFLREKENEDKTKQIEEIQKDLDKATEQRASCESTSIEKAKGMIKELEAAISIRENCLESEKIPPLPVVRKEFPDNMEILLGYELGNEKELDCTQYYNYKRELPSVNPLHFDFAESENNYPYLVLKPNEAIDIERSKDAFTIIEENIIAQFICHFPTNKKIVIIDDGDKLSHIAQNEHLQNIVTLARNSEQIRNAIFNVRDPLGKAIGQLKNIGEKNIINYNLKYPENPSDNILLLINNYPKGLDVEPINNINNILSKGGMTGIYTVLTTGTENDFNVFTYNEEAKKQALTVTEKDNAVVFQHQEGLHFILKQGENILKCNQSAVVDFDVRQKDVNFLGEFLNEYANQNKEIAKDKAKITLNSIWSSEPFGTAERRENFSDTLKIPIGKIRAKESALELETQGTGGDILVSGAKGSGKSVFLHTLILSACYHYSPEELQVNIFDFKEGVEFNLYQDKLPHVRYLALGVSVDAATELIDFLKKDMEFRNEVFKKNNNSQNIVQYNDYAKKNHLPIMPRSLVVIDEYQKILISDHIISTLDDIVRLGRNAGISLVLASQTFPGTNFDKIASQISHRIAFKNTPTEIDNIIAGCGKRTHEIEDLKGACFYKQGFDQTKEAEVIRIAFSGDSPETRESYLNEIRKKYSDYPVNQLIFSGKVEDTPLRQDDFDSVNPMLEKAQKEILVIEFNKTNPRRKFSEGYMLHFLGKHFYTGTDCWYELSPKNPLLCIVGDRTHTDSVAFTLLHDMLYLFKQNGINDAGQLFYVDLSPNRFDTPMKQLKKYKDNARKENPATTILNNVSFANNQTGFEDVIESIWERVQYDEENGYTRTDEQYTPIVTFINCAEMLRDDLMSEAYSHYCTLIEKGKEVAVYFVLLFNDFSTQYRDYKTNYNAKDVIITSSADGESVIDKLQGLKVESNYLSNSIRKNPLNADSLVLLIDDGVPSRVSVPTYNGEEYIASTVRNLYNENH